MNEDTFQNSVQSENLFLTFKKVMKYFKQQTSIDNGVISVHLSLTVPNLNINTFHICFRLKTNKITDSVEVLHILPLGPIFPLPPLISNYYPEFGIY